MSVSVVHNTDCLAFMRGLGDNAFDLALVDSPYGIDEDGSKNHTRGLLATSQNYKAYSSGDKEPPSPEFFTELFRISKNQIIWGANHMDLIAKPILAGCPPNGVIYDPFCGTATTLIGAHKLGRRWIGSEISAEYCEIANKRLKPYLDQVSLF